MDRREFIKTAALAGVSLSTLGCLGPDKTKPISPAVAPPAAAGPSSPATAYDLTVAQGTDPVSLLERGFKALGGVERYVKKGANVVIKPNFSVPRTPEEAATTNTVMVATLTKMCLHAGAREVRDP